jgi:hypothetical protein
MDERFLGAKVSYEGGMEIMLTFQYQGLIESFLRSEFEFRGKVFLRLYLWDVGTIVFNQLTWLKVIGVTACLWDHHIFDWIRERVG